MVLRGVNYIMAIAKAMICLIFLDGVWQLFNSAWEVVGGIYEWELKRTYLTGYFSKVKCRSCFVKEVVVIKCCMIVEALPSSLTDLNVNLE